MPIARYKRQTVSESTSLNQKIDVRAPQAAFEDSFNAENVQQAGALAQEYIKAQDEANQLKALEKQNELKKKVNDFLSNPETGALYTKGQDAIAAGKRFKEFYEPLMKEYQANLKGGQQTYFNEYASKTIAGSQEVLNRHLAKEKVAFDTEQAQSFIENETNAAIMNFGNLDFVEGSIDNIKQEVVKFADRNGLSAESTKLSMMQAESKTRAGVINQYIDSENPKFAKEYYETHKDTILPEDRKRIEKVISNELNFQKYQDKADGIVSKASNQVDALNRANSIEDAEERKEVKSLVRNYYSEMDQAERQVRDENYILGANLIEENPGLSAKEAIPPTVWSNYTLAQRSALEKRASGKDGSNDSNKWLDFLELRSKIANLTREEFETKYWQHFDKSHQSRAEKMWLDYKNGRGEAKTSVTNALTHNKMLRNTMIEYEMLSPSRLTGKMNKTESEIYSRFEQAYVERLEEFETIKGKKALPSERQQVMDELMQDQVQTIDEGWIWDTVKTTPRFLTEQDIEKAGGVEKAKEAFAKEEIEEVKNLVLSEEGVSLSDKDILRYHSAKLSGDDEAAQKIIDSYR